MRVVDGSQNIVSSSIDIDKHKRAVDISTVMQADDSILCCTTEWTENTRRRLQEGIESLVATCDSRNISNNESSDMGTAGTSALSEEYGKHIAQDKIDSRLGRSQISKRNNGVTSSRNGDAGGPDDNTQLQIDPLTAARRAFSPRDRSARLVRMRKKMSHSENFAKSKRESSRYHDEVRVKPAQSFDEQVFRHRKGNAKALGNSNGKNSNSENILARYFQDACACADVSRLNPIDENDYEIPKDAFLGQNDEELNGYDSDPELFQIKTSLSRKQSIKDAKEDHYSRGKDSLPNALDERVNSELIKQITHETMTLVWHPLVDETTKTSAPICVKAWVELGCRVKGQIIQPKLVWRREHFGPSEGPALPPHMSGAIDILDIARVRSLNDTAGLQSQFPLAKKSSSFVLTTSDRQSYIFEVKNSTEKQRIMLSLKLLVSRLASLIIVGDKTLFDDFFYPQVVFYDIRDDIEETDNIEEISKSYSREDD